jgi:hypothetical protein
MAACTAADAITHGSPTVCALEIATFRRQIRAAKEFVAMRHFCLAAFIALVPTFAHAADAPFTQDDARKIVEQMQKVVSPNGVDERIEIPIGGIKQWITVRGRDLRNPILLFLHGGPAAPEMPTSWTFQNP